MARATKPKAKPDPTPPDKATQQGGSTDAQPRATGSNTIRFQLLMVGLTGVLYTLAFAPFCLASVAWICLVPALIIALRTRYPGRLAWTSYIIGLIWWLLMIRWMIPVTFGGYLALSAYMAVYWPGGLLLIRHLHRSYPRVPLMITVPCVWVSLELIRDFVLAGGFGWYNLGHAMGTYEAGQVVSKIAQVADLFGEWGVSFILAMTSGFVLDLLTQPWVKPQPDGTRLAARKLQLTVLAWSLIVGVAWCYGYYRVSDTPNHTRPGPAIAIIQTNVPQDNKDSPSIDQRISDWQRLLGLSVEASYATPKPDLILWPETATPAALNREAIDHYLELGSGWEKVEQELEQIIQGVLKTPILVGGPEAADYREVEDPHHGGTFFVPAMRRNTAYYYDAQGKQWPKTYSKVHRVPFGEFIPWVEWSPFLKQQFIKYLSPYPFDYTLKPGDGVVYFPVPYERGEGAAEQDTLSSLAEPPTPAPVNEQSEEAAPGAAPAPAEDAAPVASDSEEDRHGELDSTPVNNSPENETTAPAGLSSPDGREGSVAFAVTPICFEDTVARLVRDLVYRDGEKRADLILNLTNDGWFEHTYQPWHHLQIASLRSIEHRIPTARSVNTGVSGFIDSAGRVVELVEEDGQNTSVEGWAVREMLLDDRVTVFSRIGEWPARVLVLLTALAAAIGLVWPKRSVGQDEAAEKRELQSAEARSNR